MRQKVLDIFRVPYYHALITRHGDVIEKAIVPMKGNRRSFTVKGLKQTFILPDDVKSKIPPIKLKSGRIVVYDVNSAIPMRLAYKSDEGIEWMDEELRKEYAVNPQQFYLTPLDVTELHTFLESRVTEDILAGDKKDIPFWLILLIAVGVITVGLIVVVYLVTHAPPTIITEYIPIPTIEPTAIPTLIPATMKPGI